MKSTIKFLAVMMMICLLSQTASAQSPFKYSPFKAYPALYGSSKSNLASRYQYVEGAPKDSSTGAFRFAPFVGYDFTQQSVVTGISYGWQKLTWDEPSGKWIPKYGFDIAVMALGTTVPTINPPNIISAGVGASGVNHLVHGHLTYNFGLPKPWGFEAGLTIPLTN